MGAVASVQFNVRRFRAISALLMMAGLIAAPTSIASASLRTPLGDPLQQAELTPSNGTAGSFGSSVAISGTTAVVGAPSTDLNTGTAYVFSFSGGTWTEQAELKASDAASGDNFGSSVAISGSTVVVTAPYKNSLTGSAYVFARSGGIWSQRAELTASDGAEYDWFGSSVAISGSTVVVGARGKDSNTGAAYVFVRSGPIWTEQAELTASDGAANDSLGFSIAISVDTVLIGAPFGNSGIGAAYAFDHSGSVWTERAKLTASDGAANDSFGASVAISGTTGAVGAYGRNFGTGAAYVFVNSDGTWSQQGELTPSDGTRNILFGRSVAVSPRSTVLVGASSKGYYHGAAYVFTESGGIWSERAELAPSDSSRLDHFGSSVALYRSIAVIGAPGHGATGAAYVFVNV
jgi:hypothetical protein